MFIDSDNFAAGTCILLVSDVAELKNDVALKTTNFSQQSKALALAHNSNLPPQLLLASLLEEICFFYVKDRNKAQNLFKSNICFLSYSLL